MNTLLYAGLDVGVEELDTITTSVIDLGYASSVWSIDWTRLSYFASDYPTHGVSLMMCDAVARRGLAEHLGLHISEIYGKPENKQIRTTGTFCGVNVRLFSNADDIDIASLGELDGITG